MLKNSAIGSCPVCGRKATVEEFLERSSKEYLGGLRIMAVRAKCPSCGTPLTFKFKWMYFSLILVAFAAPGVMFIFFPGRVSLFAYSIGALGSVFYLLKKFGLISSEVSFRPKD